MKLTREYFLSIIFHNFRRGLSQEYIDEIKSLFGNKAPSYSTVKNWFNEFFRGRRSLKDEVRERAPKSAVGQRTLMFSIRSKWWPVSSAKLVLWRLFHLSTVGRSILSGTS